MMLFLGVLAIVVILALFTVLVLAVSIGAATHADQMRKINEDNRKNI